MFLVEFLLLLLLLQLPETVLCIVLFVIIAYSRLTRFLRRFLALVFAILCFLRNGELIFSRARKTHDERLTKVFSYTIFGELGRLLYSSSKTSCSGENGHSSASRGRRTNCRQRRQQTPTIQKEVVEVEYRVRVNCKK